MKKMYRGVPNSPSTKLAYSIDSLATTISVEDGSVLPPAPNLATIGYGESSETILYNLKEGNTLSQIERGFEGIAGSWEEGELISRLFTSHDYNTLVDNIEDSNTNLGGIPEEILGINTQLSDHAGKHTATETRLSDIDGQLDGIDTKLLGYETEHTEINNKLLGIDGQLLEINTQLSDQDNTQINTKLQTLEGEVDGINTQLSDHESKHLATDNTLTGINDQILAIDSKLLEHTDKHTVTESRLVEIDGQIQSVNTDLTSQIEDINNQLSNYSGSENPPDEVRFTEVENSILEINNNLDKTTADLEQRGINVRSVGAVGDGISDDSAPINSAIALAKSSGKTQVFVPDGEYNIESTIIVDRGIHLDLSPGATLKAMRDINVVQLKPDSKITGGTIDTSAITFTQACIYLNGNDIFKLLNDHVYGNGTILKGRDHEYTDHNWTGKGIHLYSGKGVSGDPSYVSFVRFMQMGIFNFEYGILLETDETISTNDEMAWVNGNSFDQINMMNCLKAITLIGLGDIPRDCTGNQFSNMQVQVNAYSDYAIHCEGGWNKFEGMWWDLHRCPNKAFIFGPNSRFNRIESMHGYEGTAHYEDKGYLNIIASLTNHIPDSKTLAYPLTTPYNPNMLGNQDDYLIHGDLRGYTVTQTTPQALPLNEDSGELGDFSALFNFDTEMGVVWTDVVADYDNPLILEIDLSASPVPYMSFVGITSGYKDTAPRNITFELYDGTSWLEGDWFTKNTDAQFIVSAPWVGVDQGHKIRITMWNDDALPRTIGISRVFAMSTKTTGNAYLPKNGGEVYGDLIFPSNDVGFQMTKNDGTTSKFFVTNEGGLTTRDNPYAGYVPDIQNQAYPMSRPYNGTFLGTQDDILAHCDKRGVTITQTSSHPRQYGDLTALFTLDSEDAIRWDSTNATEADPITLLVDLTQDREIEGYHYMLYFGMLSTWTNFAQNVIIEVYDNGGWVTVLDMRGNTTQNYIVSSSSDYIDLAEQIRVKFWGANNAQNEIAFCRLFAHSTKSPGQAWMSKAGGTINGDVTTEGILDAKGGFKLEVRTTDPSSPEVGRMWFRSDL
jgi:DNA-binding FrmR family transcriptional regulator